MYKTTCSIIAAAILLFTGCGSSEEKTQATSSVEQKSSNTIVEKKLEPKKEQTVAIETHEQKEESDKAKISDTTLIEKKEQLKKETQKPSVDATAIFKSCAGCHGAKGEKKALGKSDVITGWSALKVEEALKGYRSKTRNVYGMGAVMQGQAAKLSDEEIKALGEYIEKLK